MGSSDVSGVNRLPRAPKQVPGAIPGVPELVWRVAGYSGEESGMFGTRKKRNAILDKGDGRWASGGSCKIGGRYPQGLSWQTRRRATKCYKEPQKAKKRGFQFGRRGYQSKDPHGVPRIQSITIFLTCARSVHVIEMNRCFRTCRQLNST